MAEFDIERFLDLSGRVEMQDLPLDEAAKAGITDEEAKIIRYMADTETHTILYLRDLLAGHSCHDAELTAFLSVWVYEELWHGRALDRLLAAAGRPPAADTYKSVSQNVSWREPIEAAASHLAAWATPRFAAVHMAWGAVNELTAAAAYKMLERRTKNKPLATLLARIGRQERKHYAFYSSQAHKRMVNDKWAQRLVWSVMRLAWTPVGSGVGHGEGMSFVAGQLFDNHEGRHLLQDIDTSMQKLPGLHAFDLVEKRVGKIVADYRMQPSARTMPPTTQAA